MTRTNVRLPRHGRRAFLTALGLAGLTAPFISPRRLLADGGAGTQNLILFTWPVGLEANWEPTFPSATSDPNEYVMSERLAPLAPHKDDVTFVMGLKNGYTGDLGAHQEGVVSLWTGMNGTPNQKLSKYPSIDYIVANELPEAALTAFPVLHFGVQSQRDIANSGFSNGYLHFAGSDQAVTAEDDPAAMYSQIFQNATGVDEASLARLRRERGSVLDFVKGRLDRVRDKVSVQDREKVERHLEAVRRVETGLDALGNTECTVPYELPVVARQNALTSNAHFEQVSQIQADLATIALQCGLTKVVTIDISNTDSQLMIPGINDTHVVHSVMHDRPESERRPINTFFIKQLAYLVERLKSVTVDAETGRTLLDDTLIVAGSEMAVGQHPNNPMPFMFIGGNGSIRRGRAVTIPGNQQHTRFLLTALHAMGLTHYNQIGDFTGPDAELPFAEEVLG